MAQAVEFYKKSLRLNPYMWSSFEEVCNIGEKIDPNKYFTFNSALNAYKTHILDPNPLQQHAHQQQQAAQERPLSSSARSQHHNQPQQQDSLTNPYQKQQQNIQNQILKQIDPQNDFLDQKHRLEIANMLRIVENDQQQQKEALSLGSGVGNGNKLSYKAKQGQVGGGGGSGHEQTRHQRQSSCVHQTKHNQEQTSVRVSGCCWRSGRVEL